jgi:predicted metalloprotease with PDZ domain
MVVPSLVVAQDSYTVTISEENLRVVHVEAVITHHQGLLTMDWESASHLKDGWATYLFGLEVKGADGEEVSFVPEGRASWRLEDKAPDSIIVSYDIRIGHDYIRWPDGGHNESVYVLDHSLFFVGRAVFIATTADVNAHGYENLHVEFVIPDQWQVTTTWEPKPDNPRLYAAHGIRDLVEIGIYVGKLQQRLVNLGGIDTVLSTATDFSEVLDLIETTFRPVVPGAVDFFGGVAGKRFALIANIAPQTVIDPYFGGGVLSQTMSLSMTGLPQGFMVPILNHIIAHEFLHLWIGIGISAADSEREYWLSEGFTEYSTLKLMKRLELINEDQFIRAPMAGLEDDVQKYLSVAGSISMREAGLEKGENYDLIYSGGALVAFALDVEIREGSAMKNGFEDFVQRMYQEFNSDPYAADRAAYTYQDIVRIASELAGKNLQSFFDDYVQGADVLPIGDYLVKVGIGIESTAGEPSRLRSVDTLSETQRLLRTAVFVN